MYGSLSDSGNWDHMLDGTMDSIMQMQMDQEPAELKKLDNDNQQQLQTSSLLAGAGWLEAEKQQMNQLVASMTTALDEMEWDMRKCRSSLENSSHQFQQLKSGAALWISRLDWLHQAITHDPDMVTMGRSNSSKEGDQHVSRCKFRQEKRGDVDRDGGPLLLATFQGPDDGEILSRIDLLKRNAVVVSSGNQEAPRIVSPPPGAARGGAKEEDENRAKLMPLSRQVKLPETLEATSPLETDEQG